MKKTSALTFLALSLLLFSVSPALADWKTKTVMNQIKVIDYITQLKDGVNPKKLSRPTLRTDHKVKARQANKELREMMDKAEALAKAGKHELIKDPEITKTVVSEERFDYLQQRYEKSETK